MNTAILIMSVMMLDMNGNPETTEYTFPYHSTQECEADLRQAIDNLTKLAEHAILGYSAKCDPVDHK